MAAGIASVSAKPLRVFLYVRETWIFFFLHLISMKAPTRFPVVQYKANTVNWYPVNWHRLLTGLAARAAVLWPSHKKRLLFSCLKRKNSMALIDGKDSLALIDGKTPWHSLMERLHGTHWWKDSMALIDGKTPWHSLMGKTPWHSLMERLHGTHWWKDSLALIDGKTPWHSLMERLHGTHWWKDSMALIDGKDSMALIDGKTPWHSLMEQTPWHSLMKRLHGTHWWKDSMALNDGKGDCAALQGKEGSQIEALARKSRRNWTWGKQIAGERSWRLDINMGVGATNTEETASKLVCHFKKLFSDWREQSSSETLFSCKMPEWKF